MAVAPAGHVTARRPKGYLSLPGAQAGAQFNLHILRRGALCGGKARDIVMRPLDIRLERCGHTGHGGGNLGVGHGDATLPAIKLPCIFQRHLCAACAQPGQHDLDGVGHVMGGVRRLSGGGLERGDRHGGNSFDPRNGGRCGQRQGICRCKDRLFPAAESRFRDFRKKPVPISPACAWARQDPDRFRAALPATARRRWRGNPAHGCRRSSAPP